MIKMHPVSPRPTAALPEASSRLQGGLARAPGRFWRPQIRFLERIITEQEGSVRGPTSLKLVKDRP